VSWEYELRSRAVKRFSIGRPSLSNVIVTVTLVSIFSTGAAVAGAAVRSIDIVDGEVKTVDLANGAVTNAKIAANAVTGAKVDESTLGIVPNANLLDGRDSTSFVTGPGRVISNWNAFTGEGVYLFLWGTSLETGFNIGARCATDEIFVSNVEETAPIDIWYRHNGGDTVYRRLGYNETYTATEADGPHLVTVHIVQPATQRQAMVEYSTNELPVSPENPFGRCFTYGEAVLNF
jgi:hypothetical protein